MYKDLKKSEIDKDAYPVLRLAIKSIILGSPGKKKVISNTDDV